MVPSNRSNKLAKKLFQWFRPSTVYSFPPPFLNKTEGILFSRDSNRPMVSPKLKLGHIVTQLPRHVGSTQRGDIRLWCHHAGRHCSTPHFWEKREFCETSFGYIAFFKKISLEKVSQLQFFRKTFNACMCLHLPTYIYTCINVLIFARKKRSTGIDIVMKVGGCDPPCP